MTLCYYSPGNISRLIFDTSCPCCISSIIHVDLISFLLSLSCVVSSPIPKSIFMVMATTGPLVAYSYNPQPTPENVTLGDYKVYESYKYVTRAKQFDGDNNNQTLIDDTLISSFLHQSRNAILFWSKTINGNVNLSKALDVEYSILRRNTNSIYRNIKLLDELNIKCVIEGGGENVIKCDDGFLKTIYAHFTNIKTLFKKFGGFPIIVYHLPATKENQYLVLSSTVIWSEECGCYFNTRSLTMMTIEDLR